LTIVDTTIVPTSSPINPNNHNSLALIETIEFTTGHKDQSMLFGTYATAVSVERLREAVYKLDFGF